MRERQINKLDLFKLDIEIAHKRSTIYMIVCLTLAIFMGFFHMVYCNGSSQTGCALFEIQKGKLIDFFIFPFLISFFGFLWNFYIKVFRLKRKIKKLAKDLYEKSL